MNNSLKKISDHHSSRWKSLPKSGVGWMQCCSMAN